MDLQDYINKRKINHDLLCEVLGVTKPTFYRMLKDKTKQKQIIDGINQLAESFKITDIQEIKTTGGMSNVLNENQRVAYFNDSKEVEALRDALRAKDDLITLLKQTVDLLQTRIRDLEHKG